MRQYSADQISFAWTPVVNTVVSSVLAAASAVTGIGDLSDGLAQGTFIRSEQNKPNFRQKADGVGGTVRIPMPSHGGKLTVLFDAESLEHMILVSLANADLLTRLLVGPVVIFDRNTLETDVYTEAYIETIPDALKGVNSSVIPWVWSFTKRIVQPLGFTSNVVG